MPEIKHRIAVVTRSLKNGSHLAEALLFPEVSCVNERPEGVRADIARHARRIIEREGPAGVLLRELGATPALKRVPVELQPSKRSVLWKARLNLVFHAVCWPRGEGQRLAMVPELGLTVMDSSEARLEKRLPSEILFALERKGLARSLQSLAELADIQEVRVDEEECLCDLLTPKQVAQMMGVKEAEKPVLEQVAVPVAQAAFRGLGKRFACEIEDLLRQMGEHLSAERPSPLLLVGPSGVGKTAAFKEFARTGPGRGFPASRFWMTSGARLTAWSSGYGMLEECCRRLCRELARTKDVIHLGNLVELTQAGKGGELQGVGPGEVLRPSLAAGEFPAVAECTPEQLGVLEREEAHLLQAFTQLEVKEPSWERGRAILLACADALRESTGRALGPGALEELDRLHRRYATYSVYPGRPLRFLEGLLRRGREKTAVAGTSAPAMVAQADVTAAFSRETGLPRVLLEDSIPLDPEETALWFSERVMGQPRAVDLVTDLIAVVKARLSRPAKPLASMLFIGPTGVGKTEMAKALAEYLFGDKARLTRFDMTEFLDRAAVERLIGGVFGSEGLLTAAVREQPFSVLLFDEFEKAHRLFFDLLLQVLGEGRLTDGAGNLADFRNCVVVMTSNLGAETFGKGIHGFAGDDSAPRDAQGHFKEAVRRFLRPELFNRIDSIVPFSPLGPGTLRSIVRRELDLIRCRHGALSRRLRLDVSQAAEARLAQKGCDPRYGARPLKRALARELLKPLAEAVNRRTGPAAAAERTEARVSVEGDGLEVEVKVAEGTTEEAAADALADSAARAWTGLRRKVRPLLRSAAFRDLESDAENLRWTLGRRGKEDAGKNPEVLAALARLEAAQAVLDRAAKLAADTGEAEQEALTALWAGGRVAASWKESLGSADGERRALMEAVLSLTKEAPSLLTMAVLSESRENLLRLLAGYRSSFERGGYAVRNAAWLRVGHSKETGRRAVLRVPPVSPAQPLQAAPDEVFGALFEVDGTLAALRYGRESGLHVFKQPAKQKEFRCLVETCEGPVSGYKLPEGAELKGFVSRQPLRRTYLVGSRILDELLEKPVPWRWTMEQSLADVLDMLFERELESATQE